METNTETEGKITRSGIPTQILPQPSVDLNPDHLTWNPTVPDRHSSINNCHSGNYKCRGKDWINHIKHSHWEQDQAGWPQHQQTFCVWALAANDVTR